MKTKYVVVNRYGIGGEKGKIVYVPMTFGRDSADKCEKWVKKHDTANTMAIVEAVIDHGIIRVTDI
jgi:hypothetical protein